MEREYIIIAIALFIAVVLSILYIRLTRNRLNKRLSSGVSELEIKKNNLESLPVMVELSKIEEIAKSEQLEEKINEFKKRYHDVKDIKLSKITEKILELDLSIENRDVKEYTYRYSEIEIELDEIESSLNNIIDEINEIASYEDKYRNIVTKLKTKYRFLEKNFREKETLFGNLKETVQMQFENIAKRFSDFDKVMDEKLYNEVVLVVKSIDTMIDNLDIVIKELPDILLLLNDLIPGRIKDLRKEYDEMIANDYPLGYLNFEGNLSDIEKKESDILSRAKVLNITDSLFDARVILEYLDNLFKDLELEKESKKKFDSMNEAFENKSKKLNKLVRDIYDQLDDIKALYHLNEKDLEIIDKLNLELAVVIKNHKKLLRAVKKKDVSYAKHNITIDELINKLNNLSKEFDNALHTLGSFYEDEMRAKEQLKDMNELVRKCKLRIRNYSLPVIYDKYFVEEEEAINAISFVANELENKPIVIKNLNMRVETARDLSFKLNDTTEEMIKYAYFSELLIKYVNKYRLDDSLETKIKKAELLYYRGNYKESFNLILKILEKKDEELVNQINKLCNE